MDNNNKEIKVATFQSHYGAMLLKKSLGNVCVLRPVPRSLSSSCGTCAFIENISLEQILYKSDKSLLEAVYSKEEEVYKKIYE